MRSKLSVDEALTGMEALCDDLEAQCNVKTAQPRDWRAIFGRAAILFCLGYIALDSVGWVHPIEHRLGMRRLPVAQCIEVPARLHLTANLH